MLVVVTGEQENRYAWDSRRSVALGGTATHSLLDSVCPDVFHLEYGSMKDKIQSKKKKKSLFRVFVPHLSSMYSWRRTAEDFLTLISELH